MRRSASRRAASQAAAPQNRRRRLIGAAGALVVFGGIAGITQISRADESDVSAQTKAISINGLEVLANSCEGSQLEGHDGFQKGDRCVSTAFGEVPAAANDPTLLIAQAPRVVRQNQAFTIQVSSRNLIRDRFLAAGKGGYYVESSVLQGGIVRGHIHTACRSLSQTRTAPGNPEAVPEFFVATEDQKGGRDADVVAIQVPGIATLGTLQCSSWAGDGSHRIPMMERANQTPAFDSVRIQVVRGRG
jgi:hypothetical protein